MNCKECKGELDEWDGDICIHCARDKHKVASYKGEDGKEYVIGYSVQKQGEIAKELNKGNKLKFLLLMTIIVVAMLFAVIIVSGVFGKTGK